MQFGENVFCVGGGSVLIMQDQYINHIMNETGATVILRGHGSGNVEGLHDEGNHFALCSEISATLGFLLLGIF